MSKEITKLFEKVLVPHVATSELRDLYRKQLRNILLSLPTNKVTDEQFAHQIFYESEVRKWLNEFNNCEISFGEFVYRFNNQIINRVEAIDFASSQAPKQVEPDEWISVKKGLPKNYDLVLCYGDPNDGGYHITLCEHCDGIFRFKENGKENKGTITHWKEVFFSPISENRDKGEGETYKMNNGIYGTEMSVSPTNKIKQKWTREYTKHVIDTISECPVIECNYPNCNCEKQKAIKYTYSDELARCVDCDKVNTTARRNDVPVCAGCCNKRTLKQMEEKK